MKTEILKIDPRNIEIEKIQFAADVLKHGGLVVFPTETVYGLGANALNANSVNNIFVAKGRPTDNPLILHVADKTQIELLVETLDETALLLIEKFWPGPLTMVLKKRENVSDIITAGLNTVAVRMPFHPVALSLIYEAGVPVAAPSANRSGRPSPTKAKHVIEDLNGLVDVIIDSGACKVGLESTVLDLTTKPPLILRPGATTAEELSKVLGEVKVDPSIINMNEDIVPKSPGMKYKHYAPKAKVIIVSGEVSNVVEKIRELVLKSISKNKRTGILATNETMDFYRDLEGFSEIKLVSLGSRSQKEIIAARLFDLLRYFDEENVEVVFAESIEQSGIGLAIMNRMTKASGYNVMQV